MRRLRASRYCRRQLAPELRNEVARRGRGALRERPKAAGAARTAGRTVPDAADRARIQLDKIGEGTYGVVYKARVLARAARARSGAGRVARSPLSLSRTRAITRSRLSRSAIALALVCVARARRRRTR